MVTEDHTQLWDEELHEVVHRLNEAEKIIQQETTRWNTPLSLAAGHVVTARAIVVRVAKKLERASADSTEAFRQATTRKTTP